MTTVNNMSSLIESLTEAYNDLKSGSLTHESAREISRLSGKIIGSCKVQLEYNKHMKIKNEIPFMKS